MFAKRKISAAVTLLMSGMVPALVPAFAAEDAAKQEVVVVTGSRIVRANLSGTTPVLTVTKESLGNMGMENFADMATQIPQFAPSFGSSRTQSTFSGVAASGLNNANLRNLDPVRTLVLINGRRVPGGSSTSMAVDFNTIPTANIERIEIITGGASAIYGADAVAGVINIITRKNFQGVEVNASYGETSEGDNKNPSGYIMMGGKLGDAGRGLLTLQFDKQGQVSCKDRYICAEDFAWLSPATQVRGPAARSGVGENGRFFVGTNSYTRRGDSFTEDGALIPFDVTKDGYNRNANRDLAIPTTRIMVAGEMEYPLSEKVKAFAEFNFGQTKVDSSFEGHPFQSSAANDRIGGVTAVTIPINNPFIPAALRTAAVAGNVTEMTWWQRFSDKTAGGNRGAKNDRDTARTVVGAKGEFDSIFGLGSDWRWELSNVYGRTKVNLSTEGLVGKVQLYNGLRVEADPANPGSYRCVDATARAQGCVPINPFAPYTSAMQNYIRMSSTAVGESSLNSTNASLTGALVELPAGAMRTAIGAEYRTFSGGLDYDAAINQGLVTGNTLTDTDFVKIKTREMFAELLVPILADKPFVKALNFEGAYRHSEASGDISYNTWKFGGDWEPMEGLRFRAMKARAVRAPNPGELSGGGTTAGVVNDPCTESRRNANPTRAANCQADGVPAGYAPPLVVEQSVTGLTGGNKALKPEVATTLTYGFVWQPKFVTGLALTVDRFEIDIKDIITTVSRQIAVDLCYDSRLLCNAITRGTHPLVNGNYVLTAVNEQLQNVASREIAGVDLDVRYAMKNSWGDMDFSFISTIYDEATLQPLASQKPLDMLGQAGGSTTDQGFIKFTANANVGYRNGPFKMNWNIRHIGSADMALNSTKNGFPRIPAHTYHNVRLGYNLAKSTEVYGGVTNLFNKKPPFFASGTAGTQALDTVPGYYDIFGRSYYVGATHKF
ncbi:TonB-dependent receptor [Chitinimonas prasina]|uniref:TonB-dependent receptor n=1 Tax=Chitinimonas prasina TaxID=1434937 RepID=A0ABQ5YHU8_9NEIS|nr:TonB-dependent receptor [Chitinimonas prasina]GLR13563.1 TonB-dependent receptor [Chitinimonas prasina]